MDDFNRVIVTGKIGNVPEMKMIGDKGTAILDIRLAINSSSGSRPGTTWVDVLFWGEQAQTIHRLKRKGDGLLVEGKLRVDSWEDKASGQMRSRTRIEAEKVRFIDGKEGQRAERGGGNRVVADEETMGGGSQYDPSCHERDDIPF